MKKIALIAVLLALPLACFGLEASFLDVRADASIGRDATVGDDLTVTDDATIGDDTTIGGDATVTGSATVGDDLAVTDDAAVGGLFTFTAQAQAVTNGQVITPTSNYIKIDPGACGTADATVTVSAVTQAGVPIYLENVCGGATNVFIADDGTVMATGSSGITITPTDVALLISNNTTNYRYVAALNSN